VTLPVPRRQVKPWIGTAGGLNNYSAGSEALS